MCQAVRSLFCAALVFGFAALAAPASAGWDVVSLHPAAASESFGFGIGSGQQVGALNADGGRAALWQGSAASYIDLHPPGALYSIALDVAGGVQVGQV